METVLGEGENSNGLSCTRLSARGLEYTAAEIYTLHLLLCCRSIALPRSTQKQVEVSDLCGQVFENPRGSFPFPCFFPFRVCN